MKSSRIYLALASTLGLLSGKCEGIPLNALHAPNNSSSTIEARAAPRDCVNLPGPPQEDLRWDFETANDAACIMDYKDAYQHWKVTIPNDRIFDESRIRDRGERACGSSVFDALSGGACSKGFFSCVLDKDNTAHLAFTCARGTPEEAVTEALQKGTCGAFPGVSCSGF